MASVRFTYILNWAADDWVQQPPDLSLNFGTETGYLNLSRLPFGPIQDPIRYFVLQFRFSIVFFQFLFSAILFLFVTLGRVHACRIPLASLECAEENKIVIHQVLFIED